MGKTTKRDQPAPSGRGQAAGDLMPTRRTRGLRPGDPTIGRQRRPPLPERIGGAASLVLGEELGSLVYAVLEGIKRKTIPASAGRLVLERLLPAGRPLRLDLPLINTVDDLRAANDLILAALNNGSISPAEARELQDVGLQALRAAREAEPPRRMDEVSAEERRRVICDAAVYYGMVWPPAKPD